MVVQDRAFNPDGTFLDPRSDIEAATWTGEYFGDTMLVNARARMNRCIWSIRSSPSEFCPSLTR